MEFPNMDKSVVKAFKLLELLSRNDKPMGVTDLANASALGKSNVHRLLQTLQSLDYVQKTSDNAYEATLRMWEIGSHVFSRLNLRDLSRPFMSLLSDMTKETVHLSELHGYEVLYIDKIESKEPVRAYTQLGGRAPAYCTATGKVMLAYLSEDEISDCYESVQQFTPKTIVNLDRFIIEATKIKERKYAVNRGEWRADVLGLAAPIVADSGQVVGALGLSAPASRVDIDEMETLAPRLVEFAEKVSTLMGCSEQQWSSLGTTTALPLDTPTVDADQLDR